MSEPDVDVNGATHSIFESICRAIYRFVQGTVCLGSMEQMPKCQEEMNKTADFLEKTSVFDPTFVSILQ